MNLRKVLIMSLMLAALVFSACRSSQPAEPSTAESGNTNSQAESGNTNAAESGKTNAQPGAAATPGASKTPSALPNNAFRAQITVPNVPTAMRAGQQETIRVKVKNVSDVKWPVRGGSGSNKFYVAVGNAWLDAADEKIVTNMDGRLGLPKDLDPGAEVEVPLTIHAPKEPGDYLLEIDVVQEQVSWFKDKGSQTFKSKVKVER